jgi:hypothetical protein
MVHSKQHYYTVWPVVGGHNWKVYHLDPTGIEEIVVKESFSGFAYKLYEEAVDAATDWCEDNGIDVKEE